MVLYTRGALNLPHCSLLLLIGFSHNVRAFGTSNLSVDRLDIFYLILSSILFISLDLSRVRYIQSRIEPEFDLRAVREPR